MCYDDDDDDGDGDDDQLQTLTGMTKLEPLYWNNLFNIC